MHILKYRGVRIVIKTGDITDEECDTIIIPMNSNGRMIGGVSLAIKKAGGNEIEQEVQRLAPIQTGKAVVTQAGMLKMKHVIHAIIMEKELVSYTNVGIITRALRSALYRAQELSLKTLALPGFGTGFGQIPVSEAASTMLNTIKAFIDTNSQIHHSHIKEIRIVDWSGTFSPQCIKNLDIFYGTETKPTIIAIDLIKDFIHQEGGFVSTSERDTLLQNINSLISCAHENNVPVIFVADRHFTEEDKEFIRTRPHAVKDTNGCQLIDDVKVEPSDMLLTKTRYSAFFATNLDSELETLGVNTLVICGVQSHVCVLTTALDAFYRNYRAVIVRDCVSSSTPQRRDTGLKYIEDYVGETTDLVDVENILES